MIRIQNLRFQQHSFPKSSTWSHKKAAVCYKLVSSLDTAFPQGLVLAIWNERKINPTQENMTEKKKQHD